MREMATAIPAMDVEQLSNPAALAKVPAQLGEPERQPQPAHTSAHVADEQVALGLPDQPIDRSLARRRPRETGPHAALSTWPQASICGAVSCPASLPP